MSPAGGVWAPAALRLLRKVVLSTSKVVRTRLAEAARPLGPGLHPVAVRASGRQPIHPAAFLRQKKSGRWYSTSSYANLHASVRRYLSTGGRHGTADGGARFDRSKLPVSNTSRAVSQLPGRAPFASTLRPNLTGGALPRTAGGYASPGAGRMGGQRYFSHTPASSAQVAQNVSQAVRAFWLSGQRARFDGAGTSGQPCFRAVSAEHCADASRLSRTLRSRMVPGSFVEFRTAPAITALSPLAAAIAPATVLKDDVSADGATLNTEGFLDALSIDFARSLKDLAAVMTDLKRLSELGDLPITLEKNSFLRVRFPGLDVDTVRRLCDDVGVQRGLVGQDPGFDAAAGVPVALRFPFAPDGQVKDGAAAAGTIMSPSGSMRSCFSSELSFEAAELLDGFEENPWLSSPEPEGYESMSPPAFSSSGERCSDDFEGLEGIYRFLEECDRARDRF